MHEIGQVNVPQYGATHARDGTVHLLIPSTSFFCQASQVFVPLRECLALFSRGVLKIHAKPQDGDKYPSNTCRNILRRNSCVAPALRANDPAATVLNERSWLRF